MDIKQVADEMETGQPEKEFDLPSEEQEFKGELDKELPEPQEEQEAQEEQGEEQEPDYKALYEQEKQKALESSKRYITSSKEGLKLKAKLKKLEAEKAKATTVQITDNELKEKYKDWEDYTEQEQKAIRRAENAERRAAVAEEEQKKYAQEDEFTQELDDFLEIAEAEGSFPDVRDQVDEFRKFARENKGRDLESLAKIFTFDHPHAVQTKKPSTPFGNSGRLQEVNKPQKISWQQEEALRKNDPRKYEKMLEQGLLD